MNSLRKEFTTTTLVLIPVAIDQDGGFGKRSACAAGLPYRSAFRDSK